jgi:hypothetical protein
MNRYTFVLQVHPNGHSTLENLSSHERVPVADLGEVGPQIERWLAELEGSAGRGSPSEDGGGSLSRSSRTP